MHVLIKISVVSLQGREGDNFMEILGVFFNYLAIVTIVAIETTVAIVPTEPTSSTPSHPVHP